VSSAVSRRLQLLGTVSLSLALSGCMVGPNFQAPHASVPGAYTHEGPYTDHPYVSGDAVDPQWWKSFDDPTLTQLEASAVNQNLDLKIADERLLEAESQAKIQGATLYPNLNGAASYSRNKVSKYSPMGLFSTDFPPVIQPYDLYQYGLQAQYDLDLFGMNRRAVETAIAQARASEEARRGALLNVQAQVASNYIQLRETEAVLGITQKNLDTANKLVNLTVERQQAGLTTDLDVADAKAAQASIAAQIPTLIAQRDALIGQIGLLLGQTPDGLPAELVTTQPIPLTPPVVPVGLPSTLLERRPDVREAVQNLHAATAEIGVAKAQFFPDVSFTGAASLQAMQFKDLGEWKALTYGFGPNVSLPLFEGGRLKGQLALRKAQEREAAVGFAKTVLVAFTQVNTALTNYEQEHATLDELNEDVKQAQTALDLAEDQYTQGLTDYLFVLNAQQALLAAQVSQAQSTARLGTDLVTLYQALGGGWEGQYPDKSQS
jgi:NodT family efflux transporter outer membrane factor (OMF) lipoprotein